MIKMVCPNCEEERVMVPFAQDKEIVIKGEGVKVHVQLYKCTKCNEAIEDLNNPQDELDVAYRAYRDRHGMLQPEEIKALRQKYGATQEEFARLLGWSATAIKRYEQGALQDEKHDRILRTFLSQT